MFAALTWFVGISVWDALRGHINGVAITLIALSITNIVVGAGRALTILPADAGWGSTGELNRAAAVQVAVFVACQFWMREYEPHRNRCVVAVTVTAATHDVAGDVVIELVMFGRDADDAALVGSHRDPRSFDQGMCVRDPVVGEAGLIYDSSEVISFGPGHTVYLVCTPPFLTVYAQPNDYECEFVCASA